MRTESQCSLIQAQLLVYNSTQYITTVHNLMMYNILPYTGSGKNIWMLLSLYKRVDMQLCGVCVGMIMRLLLSISSHGAIVSSIYCFSYRIVFSFKSAGFSSTQNVSVSIVGRSLLTQYLKQMGYGYPPIILLITLELHG